MLRRLALRDFVIVAALEVELAEGFSVLSGETGAGKSILVDALQLALGARADALVVREGAARAEVTAEFDTPVSLRGWLDESGFAVDDTLLLRRVVDSLGRSRAWINGSAATATQLREAGDALVDIQGQHAWQSLTRPAAVRALVDAYAQVDAAGLAAAFGHWRSAIEALDAARSRRSQIDSERERLAWQIAELEKLAPQPDEWETLDAEHRRLANAQALLDAAQLALAQVSDDDDNASRRVGRAIEALDAASEFDPRLAEVSGVLRDAQAQLDDAGRSLSSYLNHAELDPERLAGLDNRMSAWMGHARRWRRPPAELPGLLEQWRREMRSLDAASDLEALERSVETMRAALDKLARAASQSRRAAAPELAELVTQAMQQLGMSGGRFEIALVATPQPQSYGNEGAEFLVAGHAGSTPRPLAKIASGGELSRLALAIAVTTATQASERAPTLIFDEIDAGVGGSVADTVGRLMKQLGRAAQVLAVTHLPQVAACADHHFVVSKTTRGTTTTSDVQSVAGEARVAEIARMLGARAAGTSLAHAHELLALARAEAAPRKKARR